MAMSQTELIVWLHVTDNLKIKVNPLVTFKTPQNSTNSTNNMSNDT